MPDANPPDPKVVYLAGFSRSGSTVLTSTLGGVEGWFDCGELRGVSDNRPCGCGARVFECEFWSPILERIRGRYPELGAEAFLEMHRTGLDGRLSGFAAIAREARRESTDGSLLRRYADLHAELHREAGRATGARVIVDSSKAAPNAYLLASLTSVDLYVVHLVRDPRAVAHSWNREKKKAEGHEPVPVYMGRKGPFKCAYEWQRRNALIEGLVRRKLPRDRYLRVRYEDFVERPRATVEEICSFVGEPDPQLPFIGERAVRLRPNHTVEGNPVRFSTSLEFRLDDEWKTRMEPRARLLATTGSAPLLLRYGYPLRSAGRDSAPERVS